MNDFTKEELEYLKDYLIEGDSFFTRSKYVNDLIDKLQSMIDNYDTNKNEQEYFKLLEKHGEVYKIK